MKKTLFVAVAILLFFASCKKESEPTYFLKLKINGAWVTWKTALGELGPDLADPTKTDLGVSAVNDDQSGNFDITIQVDGSNFTTGTYATDDPGFFTFLGYFKNLNTSNGQAFEVTTAPGMPESRYVVNITRITSTEISGNFNGNYLYDNMNDEFTQVTEGEFNVKRIR